MQLKHSWLVHIISQFHGSNNPLAEVNSKRRVCTWYGGLARDRAGVEVRDVHNSHYGIFVQLKHQKVHQLGWVNFSSLATYGKVDQYGFIQTPPYLKG